MQATPEYLPTSFDLAHLDDYRNAITGFVQRFADAPEAISWGRNAVFDELTAKEWGALCYRHLDHHLRQFGC